MSSKQRGALRCLLLAAVVGVYAQALRFDFVSYDDPRYVLDEPAMRGGLSLAGARWAATASVVGNWQPVALLSHMLDLSLFGRDPAGHHLTSIALHAANALLLFGLLEGLTGALWRSALVAALFAVHPLHVESVVWVSERKDVLCAFFGLLALRAYARYAREPRARAYAWVALWLALGLASKPMLVSLPLVMLLLDYWPLRRLERATLPRLLLEKLPLLALCLGTAVMALHAQQAQGALEPGASLPPALRFAHAAVSYLWYAAKLAWPSDLGLLYPHPYLAGGIPWHAWQVAGSIAALLAVSAWVLLVRRPYAVVGWGWYLVMLVPVIGLVPIGVQGMADRYAYLPSIGLFLFAVWGGAELSDRLRAPSARRTLAVAAALALAALSTAAFAQVRTWRDSLSLYQRSLAVTGGRSRVHANLGGLLRAQGRADEAIALYRRGLELYPDDSVLHTNLGNALLDAGRVEDAISQYREALRLQPGYAMAHANLAVALVARGDRAGAEVEARESVRLGPELAPAWEMLGDLLLSSGRAGEAGHAYREALRLRPDSAGAREGVAQAEMAPGAAP